MGLSPVEPTDAHKAVLELLSTPIQIRGRNRMLLAPACITHSTGYTDTNHIAITCRELHAVGLIERGDVDGTYYRITWRGEAYLEGEIELDEDEIEAATS